ncbi:29555_t:CDS:2, partial [Racocetra persica]
TESEEFSAVAIRFSVVLLFTGKNSIAILTELIKKNCSFRHNFKTAVNHMLVFIRFVAA